MSAARREIPLAALMALLVVMGVACATSPALEQGSDVAQGARFVGKWGVMGSGDGLMMHPSGIAVDKEGKIYVVDTGNRRVQVFNSDGQFLAKWDVQLGGAANPRMPDDSGPPELANVRLNQGARLLFPRLEGRDPSLSLGKLADPWLSTGASAPPNGIPTQPAGIAIDADGNVYVSDPFGDQVKKFTSAGVFLLAWGSRGDGDGQLQLPAGIAIDPEGNVYVADSGNGRVQKFTPGGEFLGKWGLRGDGEGQLKLPTWLAIDDGGDVYVVDFGNMTLQRFDSSGRFLDSLVLPGVEDGRVLFPQGIAIGESGDIYIVDSGNQRVQVLTSDGEFVAKWGSSGSEDGRFRDPQGIALGRGDAFVADTNNDRIQVFGIIEP